MKAAYATDVTHYPHVVNALSDFADEVRVLRPFELHPTTYRRLARANLPPTLLRQLSRRVSNFDNPKASLGSMGWAQWLPPLLGRSPLGYGPRAWRAKAHATARTVNRRIGRPELFQFVDSTGAEVLRRRRDRPRFCICEYRNLHFSAFEQEIDVYADFPFVRRAHPLRSMLEPIFNSSDHIVVYSETAKQSFVENGIPAESISVVPLGFVGEIDYSDPSSRDPHHLVYVGRVDAYKGVDVAVDTVRRLGAPYRLTVAGPASPEAAAWLRRSPNVDYRGILTKQQLRDLWRRAGFMLAPSIESFGFAVLEALSLGTPTITRETTGVSSLLPSSVVQVVASRSPDAWAERIIDLASRYRDVVDETDLRVSLSTLSWDAARLRQAAVYASTPEVMSHPR